MRSSYRIRPKSSRGHATSAAGRKLTGLLRRRRHLNTPIQPAVSESKRPSTCGHHIESRAHGERANQARDNAPRHWLITRIVLRAWNDRGNSVTSSPRHRRPQHYRRSGRHAAPSQVQNVAEKATKAVPAMAVAGVLVAAPHATAAAKVPVSSAVIVEQAHASALVGLGEATRHNTVRTGGTLSAVTDALVIHHEPARRYTVRPGDTLSSIAQRFYGHTADWRLLYQANRSIVHDPDMIFPGEVLKIPGKPARSMSSTPATPTALTTSAIP